MSQEEFPKGVSVHWITTGFLEEANKYSGKSDGSATIYRLENLKYRNGMMRRKGQHTLCPRDEKMGAAYVDCLRGEDNVGLANLMLSYGWGNTVADIAYALKKYCLDNDLNMKRTYVWICCLCNNQHRIAENYKNGIDVPFDEFENIFRTKVVGIHNVVALLSPWKDPVYLHRTWCIFELHTAHSKGCNLDIIIPPREEYDLFTEVMRGGDESLFSTLSNTKIENSEARPKDKENIMALVETLEGGSTILNNAVNTLLRDWIKTQLMQKLDVIKAVFADEDTTSHVELLSKAVHQVGVTMMKTFGDLNLALELFMDAANMEESTLGSEHSSLVSTYINIGNCLCQRGDYEQALQYHKKALAIHDKTSSKEDSITSKIYENIAMTYHRHEEFDMALQYYMNARKINEHVFGIGSVETAGTYDSIGSLYNDLEDYDNALEYYLKALHVRTKVHANEHPTIAESYNSIGTTFYKKAEYVEALEYYRKAQLIEEKILGFEHLTSASTYNNMACVYAKLGSYETALEFYLQVFNVKVRLLGRYHSDTASACSNIAVTCENLGDYNKALEFHAEALCIERKLHGEEHQSVSRIYKDMAHLYQIKGEYWKALELNKRRT